MKVKDTSFQYLNTSFISFKNKTLDNNSCSFDLYILRLVMV